MRTIIFLCLSLFVAFGSGLRSPLAQCGECPPCYVCPPYPCAGPTIPGVPPQFTFETTHPSGFSAGDIQQKFLDFRYAAFGDTHFLKPRAQRLELAGANPNSIFQNYDTHRIRGGLQGFPNISAPGNVFSVMDINAVYKDDMWRTVVGAQAPDFANRTIHMLGSSSIAMSELVSGTGETRTNNSAYNGFDKKYTIGNISHAVALRGMTPDDEGSLIGASNHSTTAFAYVDDPNLDIDSDFYNEHNGDPYRTEGSRRFYYSLVQGTESDAWIGRSMHSGPPGTGEEEKIGREVGYHEDDLWDIRPASIYRLTGSGNFIWVDNKKLPYSCYLALHNAVGPNNAGYIERASAVESGIISFVKDSWVNVNEVRGFSTFLTLFEGPFQASNGYFTFLNDRCGSTVRDWVAIEAMPMLKDCTIRLLSGTGMMLADQDPCTMGGSARLATSLIGSEAHSAENFATAIIRGDTVIGDGSIEENPKGWNINTLYVHGGIKLQGFTQSPKLADSAPAAEAGGMMYFDLTRNTVCVSTPILLNAGTENEKRGIVWKDLAFINDSEIEQENQNDRIVTRSGNSFAAQEVSQGFEEAKEAAVKGLSPYIQPHMKVVALEGGVLQNSPVSILFNPIPKSHFDKSKFKLAWKRVATGQKGKNGQGSMSWQVIPSDKYSINFVSLGDANNPNFTFVPELVIEGVDFAMRGPDGYTGEKTLIQLMAVTAEGCVCGASFLVL
jgi:hypothetical protein